MDCDNKKLSTLDVQNIKGFSEAEAEQRLRNEGPNELPTTKPRSIFAIAFEVVREPMFLLLVACGVIYLLLGDVQEALMLLGFVFVVMGITLYQERKTERALEALRDLSSPRALVIRDGQKNALPAAKWCGAISSSSPRATAFPPMRRWFLRQFLRGRIAADRRIGAGAQTGPGSARPWAAGGDDLPFVYSGTLVVKGQGVARVLATGMRTEIGKIGKALQTVEPEDTLLQKETGRMVRNLAIVGLSLCARGRVVYGLTRGELAGRASWPASPWPWPCCRKNSRSC